MVEVMGERERGREREAWRRTAFLAAEIINISGKTVKGHVKPDQLVKFEDEKPPAPVDIEKRKREAAETLKRHKAKFWTKFKDESVAKLTGDDNG